MNGKKVSIENEKKENVSHRSVLKWTCFLTLICCVTVGYFGGIAFFPYYKTPADMLSKLNNFKPDPTKLANPHIIAFFKWFGPISGYIYPLIQSASGIPPFCSIIRYNLLNAKMLKSKWSANIIAIAIPFCVSIILYHGNGFNNLLNWTGVLFASFINFILPIYFRYKSLLRPKSVWYLISKSEHHLEQLDKSNICLDASEYEENMILTYNDSEQGKITKTMMMNPENVSASRNVRCFLVFTTLISIAAFGMDMINLLDPTR